MKGRAEVYRKRKEQLMCTWLFRRQKLEEWACGSVPDTESAADLHVVLFFNYASSVFLIQTFAS
jgi:hypothetical protein